MITVIETRRSTISEYVIIILSSSTRFLLSMHIYELVTVIDKEFILRSEKIVLLINANDNFVFIINEEEFIGSKIINLHLLHTNFVHIIIENISDTVTLFLNGQEMFSISSSTLSISQQSFTLQEESTKSRLIHITTTDLTPWIEYRNSKFKIKSSTSEEYHLIDIKEQMKQLVDITDSIKDLIDLINKGKKQHIVHLLSSLRSLIYYRDRSSNYDPLLLRLAAYNEVGLPVYTHELFPDVSLDESSFSISPHAKSLPSSFNTKMIDFQNYLESPFINIDGKLLSLLDFIGNAATTKSAAHFDQRIPRVIGAFDNIPVLHNITIFDRTIINLALLVIDMAQIVLKNKT